MQGVQGDYEMQPQLVQMELDQGGALQSEVAG